MLTKAHRLTLIFLLIASAAVILGVQAYLGVFGNPRSHEDIRGLLWPNSKPIAPFSLEDQRGQPFGLEQLKGNWTFLFFGYMNCPDVCPAALQVMNYVDKLLAQTPEAKENVQFAFVSVDPARDNPEHLAPFIRYFKKDFLAITGPEEKLKGLTRQLGILYMYSEPEADGSYLVDHTAAILLTGPDGSLIALFSAPHDPVEMADRFKRIRELVDT